MGFLFPIMKGIVYGIYVPITLPAVIYDRNNIDDKHYRHLFLNSSRGLDFSRGGKEEVQSKLKKYFESKD